MRENSDVSLIYLQWRSWSSDIQNLVLFHPVLEMGHLKHPSFPPSIPRVLYGPMGPTLTNRTLKQHISLCMIMCVMFTQENVLKLLGKPMRCNPCAFRLAQKLFFFAWRLGCPTLARKKVWSNVLARCDWRPNWIHGCFQSEVEKL